MCDETITKWIYAGVGISNASLPELQMLGLFQPEDDSAVAVFAQRESGPDNYRVDEPNIGAASTMLKLSELRLEGENNQFPRCTLWNSVSIKTSFPLI